MVWLNASENRLPATCELPASFRSARLYLVKKNLADRHSWPQRNRHLPYIREFQRQASLEFWVYAGRCLNDQASPPQ
jgi:hypothetical protein